MHTRTVSISPEAAARLSSSKLRRGSVITASPAQMVLGLSESAVADALQKNPKPADASIVSNKLH
jgi:methionine-rich copper-binding protein CopC